MKGDGVPNSNAAAASRYRLVAAHCAPSPMRPSSEQREVIGHRSGRLKVLAGPGTGKTATIVEAIAHRVMSRGLALDNILVLTFSRRAAQELSQRLAQRIDMTTSEPVVRTLHSYAYALLRQQAIRREEPPPSLLEAGQADLMVREILAGHADDAGRYWPSSHHAALLTPSFAAELRDFMLRTAERAISPATIAQLGQSLQRPEWVAAAQFIEEYRDIAELRQGTTRRGAKLDQAELMVAAVECLQDPDVLAAQQERIRCMFVDEYQDVDPAQAELIDILGAGAEELVVVGDPDQSIYTFRGAAAGAMQRFSAHETVSLTVSRRMSPSITAATRRIASRIPGVNQHRALQPAVSDGADYPVQVRTFTHVAQEASFIADTLRRAHVVDGVPWSQMAILLRAPAHTGDVYRRALSAAGIPVSGYASAPLADQPIVAALLRVLEVAIHPESLTSDRALSLLTSPLGGLDALMLRRLRRSLKAWAALDAGSKDPAVPRRTADIIRHILSGDMPCPQTVPYDLAEPVRRVATLIRLAAENRREPAAETVIWSLWQASGLEDELVRQSRYTATPRGRQANESLDAVIGLLDRAAALADQLPAAGIVGLLDLLADEQLRPGDTSGARVSDEDVAILSAHSAKGLEWRVVAVAGVQDEAWPDVRPRTSLLEYEKLIDAAAGLGMSLPAASVVADERRLFYVAATRAQERLIVTAVDNEETAVSRFVLELTGGNVPPHGWPRTGSGQPQRQLSLPALVAELRSAAVDPERADRAAAVLAELAAREVRGAAPDSWYGLRSLTTTEPLVPDGEPVTLSPSMVESLQECALRTVLVKQDAGREQTTPQLLGVAVHALAQGIAAGATDRDLAAVTSEFLASQDHLPPWEVRRLRRRMNAMRHALEQWIASHRADRTFVSSEAAVDVLVMPPAEADHPHDSDRSVRLQGRIDYLSVDRDGRVVVTDFKTGATKPSLADTARHPQLASYQLAVALGGLAQIFGDEPPELAGAELVFVGAGKPELRSQEALSAGQQRAWADQLTSLAEQARGPGLVARSGRHCDRCPVRSSCPVQPEGRQITR